MLFSCQNDCWNFFGIDNKVDVILHVSTPTMDSSRGETSGLDSALGAINNFDNNSELWNNYDLRYIIEIYEVISNSTDSTISTTPIYKRQIHTSDHYIQNDIQFETQVIANRTYLFVIWADFVEENKTDDLYYDTTNLREISRKQAYAHTAMEEALDAYHICATETITSSTTLNLTLTRPLAKLRVVALDYNEISNYSKPTNVSVKFDTENNPVYKTFNALTSEISNNCITHEFNYSVDPMPYQEYSGTTTSGENLSGFVLFSDYIFAPRDISKEVRNEYPVSFSMTIIYDNNEEINHDVDFDTQIPLSRNYLTTLVSNCLTQSESFIVKIDDTLLSEDVIDAEQATK